MYSDDKAKGRRVSSVVEHSSANPKVHGLILELLHLWATDYDKICFLHLTPEVVHNFPKAMGV